MDSAALAPVSFASLEGWREENHTEALRAFLPCARRMQSLPYKTRGLGINGDDLAQVAALSFNVDLEKPGAAKAFFETFFVPLKVMPSDNTKGFLTGFFEPVVEARLEKSSRFCHPLYARPPELIDVGDDNRPNHMSPEYRFGTMVDGTVQHYLDRAAIQSGALDGRGLEIAWLEDPVDVFFIHVQGAAKLRLGNGEFLRVTYAAKAGHAYTSVAKLLCAQEGLEQSTMTADRLADWLRAHPQERDALLNQNRSYIFFKTVDDVKPDDGPIAAAKTPLIAGRSMAVDRTLHTFGSPIWLSTKQPLPENQQPLRRLMFAHDTGSAITGPVRGDIFTGSGEDAGRIAGRVRHEIDMVVLVPKPVQKGAL